MEATQMDSDILPQAKKKKKTPRRKELNLQTSIVYLLEPEISYSSVPWSSIVDHSSLFWHHTWSILCPKSILPWWKLKHMQTFSPAEVIFPQKKDSVQLFKEIA